MIEKNAYLLYALCFNKYSICLYITNVQTGFCICINTFLARYNISF